MIMLSSCCSVILQGYELTNIQTFSTSQEDYLSAKNIFPDEPTRGLSVKNDWLSIIGSGIQNCVYPTPKANRYSSLVLNLPHTRLTVREYHLAWTTLGFNEYQNLDCNLPVPPKPILLKNILIGVAQILLGHVGSLAPAFVATGLNKPRT